MRLFNIESSDTIDESERMWKEAFMANFSSNLQTFTLRDKRNARVLQNNPPLATGNLTNASYLRYSCANPLFNFVEVPKRGTR
jgi:hypothetical protein